MKSRSTFVVLLLFMWTVVPAMRCASQALTPAEQACCKAMGTACGETSNHSCCEKAHSATQAAVITANIDAPTFVPHKALPLTTAALTPRLSLTTNASIAAFPVSPPTLSNTVLRI